MKSILFFADFLMKQYREEPAKTVSILVDSYIDELNRLESVKTVKVQFPEREVVMSSTIDDLEPFNTIARATCDGDIFKTLQLLNVAIENRISRIDIVMKGLLPGIQAAVALYDARIFFAPELLVASNVIKEATKVATEGIDSIERKGKVLIHAPEGDLHDIGKNIVKIVLEANFFEVIDLGVDVSPQKLVDATKKYKPILITGSALMTTTMPGLICSCEALKAAGFDIPFGMGGATVTQEWVEQTEFGVYGRTPKQAVEMANLAVNGQNWKEIREQMHKR